MRRLLTLLALLCWAPPGPAATAIPGGLVEFDLGTAAAPAPVVYFGNRQVLTVDTGGRWTAWVGIDLDTPPGDYVVRIQFDEETVEHRVVTITPRRYLVTEDASPNRSLASAMLAAAADIPSDAWREPLDTELPLTYPLAGPYTNHFGARVLDPQYGSHWRYELDFEAPGDATLIAPGGGVAHRMPIRANGAESICIDHGMGLLTCVGPVLDVQVHTGEQIERARPLGHSVSDPEGGPTVVSWLVRLNGVQVDPERFLPVRPTAYSRP